jgi:hypothetical protein
MNYYDLLCEEVQSIIDLTDLKAKAKFFSGWWNKTDCAKHSKALFVFGDNDIQKGCKGQAVIRYCDNSIGLSTKKVPSYAITAYYTDTEFEEQKNKIINAIEDIVIESDKYDIIYFPEDGLGTGLSKLDEKAPRTLQFLNEVLDEVFGIVY